MFDLIDIGANLTHDSFDADRDAVLARAAAAGVARIVVTGTSVTSSVQAAEHALNNGAEISSTTPLFSQKRSMTLVLSIPV